MKRYWLTLLFALLSTSAFAQYTTGTPLAREPQADGHVNYVVLFTGTGEDDIKDVVTIERSVSEVAPLKLAMQLRASQLKSKKVPLPVLNTPVDLVVAPPTPPDPVQVAWATKRFIWEAAKQAVANGWLAADDVDWLALDTAVHDDFRKSYIGIVSK